MQQVNRLGCGGATLGLNAPSVPFMAAVCSSQLREVRMVSASSRRDGGQSARNARTATANQPSGVVWAFE